jgi:RimJ/RimL family protein N-acetyltransferase
VESESRQPFRIETKALVLRPLELRDAPAVYALSNEPAARQWLPSQVHADEDAARGVLAFLVEQCASPGDPRHGPFVLAVEHRGDGTLIGHVGLSPFEDEVEIGFAVAEAYQGRGLAVEAVRAACRWAFASFGLPGILAIAAQSNRGSRKVLARAGFEHRADRVMCFQGTEQAVSVYCLSGPDAAVERPGDGREGSHVRLRRFEREDAEVLAAVSRRAFENDVRHGAPEPGGPPGYDSPDWQLEMGETATAYLVIVVEDRVVGGMIVFGSAGEYWLGRMFIDPDQQGCGIGTAAVAELEQGFPDARLWSLETPPWNRRNHRFYEKVGYSHVGSSDSGDYLYEKSMTERLAG